MSNAGIQQGTAEMQKETDAYYIVVAILQVDSGGLPSRLAHVTSTRD
jgi:hypothetical protein